MTSLPKDKLVKNFIALMSDIDIAHGDKAFRDFSTIYNEDLAAKLLLFQNYSTMDQQHDTFYFSDLEVRG